MIRWLRHRLALPFLEKAVRHQNDALWAFSFYPVDTTGYALAELNWALGAVSLVVGNAIAGDTDA